MADSPQLAAIKCTADLWLNKRLVEAETAHTKLTLVLSVGQETL